MIGILSFFVGTYIIEWAGRLAVVWLILAMFAILCALFLPERFFCNSFAKMQKARRIFLVFCLAILGGVIFAASRADIGVIALSWSLVVALVVASATNAALGTKPWYLNGLNLVFLCLTLSGCACFACFPRLASSWRAELIRSLNYNGG